MDSTSDSVAKILEKHLADLLQLAGLDGGISKVSAMLVIGVLVLVAGTIVTWQVKVLLEKLSARIRNNKAARDLNPEFDYLTIKGFRDIFIPTRYARITPNRYDNPHEAHKHNEPRKLIPFMMKQSFNERVENEKFYLILADSGMGKTAFMVNLYMACHSFFNFRRKKMKLFRFQPPDINNPVDIIDRVKQIEDEEAKSAILLLDGLDEDPFIISKNPDISDDQAFEERLNKIVGETARFCDVVITCRTQYFPQQELQDYELNIRKPNGGFYKLNKYYLFPFSNAEVRKYLNKKYGVIKFWNWSEKRQAARLVKNSHQLMSRPMLMSYLSDLIGEDKEYQSSCQIYETLIDKWLIRESEKWKKSDQREKFKKDLADFTREAALRIYRNWQSKGTLHISKNDAIQIARICQIDLKPDEVKGKSLLTCDPLLNWKFAHKSILEYFLAKECHENREFASGFNFASMDMAKHFYMEMLSVFDERNFVKVEGGIFMMGSADDDKEAESDEKPRHQVKISNFYISQTPVTQKQWRDFMGSDPGKLRFKGRGACPVEGVSWHDAQDFIKKLNRKTGKVFRLPTEAEWEYAARGGSKSKGYKFSGGDKLDDVGWYDRTSDGKTSPVKTKAPNELGIYDMSGNVWEWCQDKWHNNYEGAPTDGSAWESGDSSCRVVRGGSWRSDGRFCRVARRNGSHPEYRLDFIGFRLVLVP